jgi:hypothetical protein
MLELTLLRAALESRRFGAVPMHQVANECGKHLHGDGSSHVSPLHQAFENDVVRDVVGGARRREAPGVPSGEAVDRHDEAFLRGHVDCDDGVHGQLPSTVDLTASCAPGVGIAVSDSLRQGLKCFVPRPGYTCGDSIRFQARTLDSTCGDSVRFQTRIVRNS